VPEHGIGYGVWRYLAAGADEREPTPEVSFNYLGQVDQVLSGGEFRPATESGGLTQSPYNQRPHLLAIGAMVVDGQLQMNWGYSAAVHRRETIERVAAQFVEKLQALIEHCQTESIGGHTPSDFPLARIDQTQLETIETKYPTLSDMYPLTPLQQGLIFHSFFAPQSGLYYAQSSLRLWQLDKEAFQRAWQKVIDRHDILRTAFVTEGIETPVQVVLNNVELTWHEEDWTAFSPDEVEEKLAQYMEADRLNDFDFSAAPIMRVALMQIAADEYHFIWTSHHVLLDGWSIPVLIKEMATLYEAGCRGEAIELAKPRPYRDYIAWLEKQDDAAAEQFWTRELDGVTGPTTLSIDLGALSGMESHIEEHGEQELRLDEDLTAQLRELGRQEKVTLNTIVQGAWALLLSRYSGDSRVVFGTTVAGRPMEVTGVESMVGVFINTVPLAVEVDETADVLNWLKQLQQKHLELRHFEHTPLVKIQSWIDMPRGVPLYENLFTFQNYPVERKLWEDGAPNGLQVEARKTESKSHYALAVRVAADAEMHIRITHDRDRFPDASIKRMLGHLQSLLVGIALDPARQLFELELLSDYEEQSLLEGGNNDVMDYAWQQ
jgi:non-ribosomal peptide synthase protein (TIGR01720 family)